MQKELRKTLLRYRLHTDQDLFDRAYAYIKQYYLDYSVEFITL